MAVSQVRVERRGAAKPRPYRAANSPYAPDSTSNVRVLYGSDPAYGTISDSANARYQNAGMVGQFAANTNQAPSTRPNNVQVQHGRIPEPPTTETIRVVRPKPKPKKKRSTAKKAFVRAKVTAATPWVMGWSAFWYVMVQLPFAVVSTMGLGVAAYVYSYIESVLGGRIADMVLNSLMQGGTMLSSALRYVAERFFNLSFDPLLIFFIPFILLFILGLIQLLMSWFIYSLAGARSLSGQSGGAKVSLFMLAAIGVCIPVLNLFPFILIWQGVVWLRPN